MLSVIIPTDGAEQPAVATLSALVPGAAAGVITDVLLVDRSSDTSVIERVADVAGCNFMKFEGSHAAALAAGAAQAKAPWLMFLPVGAVLDPGWIDETVQFVQSVAASGRPRAGVFRYARSPYAEISFRDRLRAIARTLVGPLGDQGLLIARDHYRQLGGHAPNARRAETRLLRQIGRSRTLLRSRMVMI
ncbi:MULTISPECIES: glycosyl transferase [unclassified Bradyrhizobium]|uniref:glycosyl transferase n=1 Tax=unclassified Bradyrhizobium TaxID=2631580 RepID=UPI0028E72D9F|nr:MULTISPECIES: glycosyl transferase [unclassified Bradyrhizobium]